MYNLLLEIKYGDESYVYPKITAIDVKDAAKYFNTDHYNSFLPDDFYFNDLKMFEPVYEDIVYDHFNDYQFWAGESPLAFSVPVSQKFRDLFERFDIAGCKFYAGDLNFKGKKYPFNVFHYLSAAWFDTIDEEKTIFCERISTLEDDDSSSGGHELIGDILTIKTIEEYYENKKRLFEIGKACSFEPLKLVGFKEIHLKEKKDFIYFPDIRCCVSERLKNAIEEAGLTGIEFKAIEHVDFYCNGEKL
jgi:hypothetical protein